MLSLMAGNPTQAINQNNASLVLSNFILNPQTKKQKAQFSRTTNHRLFFVRVPISDNQLLYILPLSTPADAQRSIGYMPQQTRLFGARGYQRGSKTNRAGIQGLQGQHHPALKQHETLEYRLSTTKARGTSERGMPSR